MTIATILRDKGHDVISVPVGTPVREVVALLASRRIGAMPVTDGDAVVGIVSERDILYSLANGGAALLDQKVEEIMTTPPITVTPDTPVLQCLGLITRKRVRHLPVIEGGRLIGFVSIGDLVKKRIDGIEEEAKALRDYIQGS
jgi:CBS domain-containing protein